MEDVTYLIFLILSSILLFLTTKYSYWRRKNVVGPTPLPLLGNYSDFFIMKKTSGHTVKDIYDKYSEAPFVGAYFGTEPVLIPKDLEIIRTIMAKDFHKFNGRLLVDHEYRDPTVSSNLFFTSGDNWKTLRQNLNPMFTSGKLKHYFGLVMQCADKFDTYLEDLYRQSDVQDFKQVATNFILECIGSTLFGTNFEAMVLEDRPIKNLAYEMEYVNTNKFIKNNIREVWPNLYHLFTSKSPLFGSFINTFAGLAQQSFQSRNYKPIGRKDLVDFLLKFKEQGFLDGDGIRDAFGDTKKNKLEATDSLLISQVMVFFGAGFATSSMSISFTLFELAKNFHIQKKLVNEIDEALQATDGKITYESIQSMKYLDMVVLETLRKYPVLGIITRECMADYKFLDNDLTVEKGTRIHIPVWAIHHDPKYYPEPLTYDPERFSPEQVKKRHPYAYLAFGEGQRICIGMRFGKMQVAVGLIEILRKYRIENSDETPEALEFDPRTLGTVSSVPIYLKMIPRNTTCA